MDLEELAHNVRRLRDAKGFSQETLADTAGISLPAVKNLERLKSKPRMRTVQLIAQALGVKLQDLFQPIRRLQNVRFRAEKRIQYRENILADVARWLVDFNYLERVLGDRIPRKFKRIPAGSSQDACIKAAYHCRNRLGLKLTDPIYDICGLLEHCGVKIYLVSYKSHGFSGLSIREADGGPAIVVNTWERIITECRIFSVAHELGHLIMHKGAFDVNETEIDPDEEEMANLFARHFLMPDGAFEEEWNRTIGLHFLERVFKVKRIFSISYKTVLNRLIELDVVDDSIWEKFESAFQAKYGQELSDWYEPMRLKPVDFTEDRFSRLVRKAVEQDEISLSRGAEMLRISIEDMQELMHNLEVILI